MKIIFFLNFLIFKITLQQYAPMITPYEIKAVYQNRVFNENPNTKKMISNHEEIKTVQQNTVIPNTKEITSKNTQSDCNCSPFYSNYIFRTPDLIEEKDPIYKNIGDIAQSAKDIVAGAVRKIPYNLPSFQQLYENGKNNLIGYPFETIFGVVNSFCSTAISAKTVSPASRILPDVNSMNINFHHDNGTSFIKLSDADQLPSNIHFDVNNPLVILITGWTTNANDTENAALDLLYKAYRCRGDVNFAIIDTAGYIDSIYTWSAFNTEEIGKKIAQSLVRLTKIYDYENMIIIGHSLGAHIAGSVGRHFNLATEDLLPRIIGLDPANPCFNEGETLGGLGRGDAEFVMVIHSNSGALGKREPIGDVDFFPNGVQPLPPGCYTITCAHLRAVEYYAESVYLGNEMNFLALKCNSLSAYNSQYCNGRTYPMGYATPSYMRGNFFLNTNSEKPYGKSAQKDFKPKCKKNENN